MIKIITQKFYYLFVNIKNIFLTFITLCTLPFFLFREYIIWGSSDDEKDYSDEE